MVLEEDIPIIKYLSQTNSHTRIVNNEVRRQKKAARDKWYFAN